MNPTLRTLLEHCFDERPPPAELSSGLTLQGLVALHWRLRLPMPPLQPSPGMSVAQIYYHFVTSSPPDEDAPTPIWYLMALALMEDAPRLARYRQTHSPSLEDVKEAYLALGRRNQLSAMALLEPVPTAQWELLEVALKISSLPLFEQALSRLTLTGDALYQHRQIVSQLAQHPHCCRLFLLATAAVDPGLVSSTLLKVAGPDRAPPPWLLGLGLKLVDRGSLWLEFLTEDFILTSEAQVQQLLTFADARPALERPDLTMMLFNQGLMEAPVEVLKEIWQVASQYDADHLAQELDQVLSLGISSPKTELGAFFVASYPGLTFEPALERSQVEQDSLGPGLCAYVAHSQALFEQLEPLLSEAAFEVFHTGVVVDSQLYVFLKTLSAAHSFNLLYWLSLITEEHPLSYSQHQNATGDAVLKRLRQLHSQERLELVLAVLGRRPMPASATVGLSTLKFCLVHRPLQITTELLPLLLETSSEPQHEILETLAEGACIYGRADVLQWLLDQQRLDQETLEQCKSRLTEVPARQELLAMLMTASENAT